MKVMFICKKHYKQLMAEFKKLNPPTAVEGVLKNLNIGYNLTSITGEPFRIHIQPYLKKIKIVDVPEWDFKLGAPEISGYAEIDKGWQPWMSNLVDRRSRRDY